MKITELPMGSQVTVRSGLGTDFLDFESKIIKNNPKEDAVFLEPIRQNNRTLDFSSVRLINTASVVSDRDDKAYVYHNVKIDYVREEDQGYHRIITPDDVEAVNRRKYFRMYLGTDGVMQGGSHKKTYDITVKDISVNGFAVVCSIDADLDLGAYSTGSSIMPQKKNPDIAELVRGKTGRVYGALTSLLTTMKGIPLAYNKDMQEDKELVFDAIDTTKGCLVLFTGMLKTMKFNDARMEESAKHGFTNATDAADYLVNHGVPFRDAHGIVGQLVLYCIEHKKALDDMTMEEFKAISPVFEEDIYDAISMKTCVEMRNTIGAPGKTAMEKVIAIEEAYLVTE